MKRIRIIVCVILSAVLVTCMFALADGIHVGYINATNTPIYTKSFTELISRAANGTPVLYWSCGVNNVVKIVNQKGEEGYCYEGFITPVAEVSKSEICKTTNASTIVYKMNKKGKLVKRCTIGAGLPVVLAATNGEWAKVRNLKGSVGYIKIADLAKVW